jgi:hypothetical protein
MSTTMVDSRRFDVMVDRIQELSERMERGFAQVDEAFAEQRQFIEFIFDKLDKKMDAGFARIDARLAQHDLQFAQIDKRFAQMDARFAQIEARLDRIERTLLQFIDAQIRTNELVERRLTLLERANPMRPM